MFSKKERDYLLDRVQVPKYYGYVLEHRIKKKLKQFLRLEMPLITENQNLTEYYKILTEKYKLRAGIEPATFTLPR